MQQNKRPVLKTSIPVSVLALLAVAIVARLSCKGPHHSAMKSNSNNFRADLSYPFLRTPACARRFDFSKPPMLYQERASVWIKRRFKIDASPRSRIEIWRQCV